MVEMPTSRKKKESKDDVIIEATDVPIGCVSMPEPYLIALVKQKHLLDHPGRYVCPRYQRLSHGKRFVTDTVF